VLLRFIWKVILSIEFGNIFIGDCVVTKFIFCFLFVSDLLFASISGKGGDVVNDPISPSVSESSITFSGDIRVRMSPIDSEGANSNISDYYKEKSFQLFYNKGSTSTNQTLLAKGQDGVVDSTITNKSDRKASTDLFWHALVTREQDSSDANKHIFVIKDLKVTRGQDSSISIFGEGSDITFTFGFSTGGNETDIDTYLVITNEKYYPIESPRTSAVKPLPYTGEASWKNPASITYFADEKPVNFSNRVLVVAVRDDFDQNINVRYFLKDPATKNPKLSTKQCPFNLDKRELDCDIDEDKYHWFIDSEQESSSTFILGVAEAGKLDFKINKAILPEKEYYVILQYERGLERTEAVTFSPVATASLGGKHELGDPRCFVVSAAFGSEFSQHIDIFRWFRDKFLLSTNLGERIVDFYYNNSLPFANFISESSALKTTMRLFLWPLAGVLYLLQFIIGNLWLVSGLFFLGLIWFVKKRVSSKASV
jgi:hypothetical protein